MKSIFFSLKMESQDIQIRIFQIIDRSDIFTIIRNMLFPDKIIHSLLIKLLKRKFHGDVAATRRPDCRKSRADGVRIPFGKVFVSRIK